MLFNIKTFKTALGAFAAVALFSSAAPALANSAASADIAAPLRAAEAAKAGVSADRGDEEFRRLFANWQSLDNGILPSAKPTTIRRASVSIPSLAPVAMTRLSSSYGMREHPVLGGRRAHKGIDLAAPTGTPIRASADGIVEKAEWFGGYGLFVQLDHGGAMETRYGHMSRVAVAEGQQVRKGDVIGYVGSTGRSTGPHLHYEVRVSGEAVNPVPYMQGSTKLYASNNSAEGRGGPEEE
ncbi:peptidase M23B [Novosphingobium aromaticivorans DSM 12444]|uniref:Peptidase M23B n=1 Tax=Novosphingobium aromaticivorans (strain ATCC 700278 / DSM 12444 / CCUG 56034 / CIP 105152 / NBRC 16084 / F199) TaxID=279238 RepID=Q2G3I1_NOVAD|nr:M23 family metallopeptidase [Novosphingobium aromaticivorans]ABD27592.1 peptidase M23B [Novosphingobium aromaticivorans DSM 12444]SCY72093.1 Peptidase family M23 [Novosphingobium aromaticivorans]